MIVKPLSHRFGYKSSCRQRHVIFSGDGHSTKARVSAFYRSQVSLGENFSVPISLDLEDLQGKAEVELT